MYLELKKQHDLLYRQQLQFLRPRSFRCNRTYPEVLKMSQSRQVSLTQMNNWMILAGYVHCAYLKTQKTVPNVQSVAPYEATQLLHHLPLRIILLTVKVLLGKCQLAPK